MKKPIKKKETGYEASAVDKKLDKTELKKGIKEGSKKDLAVDKVAKKSGLKAGQDKLKAISKNKK